MGTPSVFAYLMEERECLRVEASEVRAFRRTFTLHHTSTMVSSVHLVAITLAVAVPIHAFTSTSSSIGCAGSRGYYQLGAATDDASAQALSDYMSKSHEEKLRAIKVVEDKKNAEIEVRSDPYFIVCMLLFIICIGIV